MIPENKLKAATKIFFIAVGTEHYEDIQNLPKVFQSL